MDDRAVLVSDLVDSKGGDDAAAARRERSDGVRVSPLGTLHSAGRSSGHPGGMATWERAPAGVSDVRRHATDSCGDECAVGRLPRVDALPQGSDTSGADRGKGGGRLPACSTFGPNPEIVQMGEPVVIPGLTLEITPYTGLYIFVDV